MKSSDHKLELRARNMGFIGIQCATFGFFLLEACLIQLKAKPIAHAVSMVIVAFIVAMIFRHMCICGLKSATHVAATDQEKKKKFFNPSDLVSTVFLVSVGYMQAVSAGSQWITLPALFAIGVFLFPWSILTLCRKNLPASWLMMNVGVAVGFLTQGPLPHPIFLGLSTWVFLTAATVAWLSLVFLKWEKTGAARARDHKALADAPDVMHH